MRRQLVHIERQPRYSYGRARARLLAANLAPTLVADNAANVAAKV
jgi:hypothetical protein